ncbi:hypothetical protein AV530_001683 [Patagioenas fasciata monilis]|uniref:Uncharacterized protein n=1 Tax=Patagioenas fasciata monilis TaxID=372326 RepID=A0A1V4KM18_PATFA|nr:hypothetical protein AV530_001683 [Patagioenas fasciata monilis]
MSYPGHGERRNGHQKHQGVTVIPFLKPDITLSYAAFLKAPLLPLRQKWQLKFLKSFITSYRRSNLCCSRGATFLPSKEGGN